VVVAVNKDDDDDEADVVSMSELDTTKGRYERPNLHLLSCEVAKASAASRGKKPQRPKARGRKGNLIGN
jgi:hypothetical protein